jgi:replicative DNA helicase Mcm
LGDGAKIKDSHGYSVKLHQSKPEGIAWVDDLLERMGWPHRRAEYEHETIWFIRSRELQEYLSALQVKGTHELKLPSEAFTEWGPDVLFRLYEGLMVSDGVRGQRVLNETGWVKFCNTSEMLVDDVQRLLIHLGMSGSKRLAAKAGSKSAGVRGGKDFVSRHDRWEVNVDSYKASRLSSSDMKQVDYDGMVYCLTVPNGTLLVRRDGIPMFCGNCLAVLVVDLLKEQISGMVSDAMTTRMVVPAVKGDYTIDTQRGLTSETRQGLARRGKIQPRTPFDDFYQRRGKVRP